MVRIIIECYLIGDFVKVVGFSVFILCYYEKVGLIELYCLDNGWCYYEIVDINWVKFLLYFKGMGMSISEL